MNRSAWILVGVAVAVFMAFPVFAQREVPLLLATTSEVLRLPLVGLDLSTASVERLYVIALPQTDLAVVLRPIPEEEYGTYQVQAIAPEMIDLQMLAAAFVLPVVTEQDVGGLTDDVLTFLRRMVNWVSGYDVFDEGVAALADGD